MLCGICGRICGVYAGISEGRRTPIQPPAPNYSSNSDTTRAVSLRKFHDLTYQSMGVSIDAPVHILMHAVFIILRRDSLTILLLRRAVITL